MIILFRNPRINSVFEYLNHNFKALKIDQKIDRILGLIQKCNEQKKD
jgi:hypothetical protein